MGCQEPNDDKASKTPNEALYNTENILVDINEKRIAAWNSNNSEVADDHQWWNGYKTGYDLNTGLNSGTTWNNTTIAWSFKRAKAFTDVVYYWGTGGNLTLNHNLGVAPDMIIVKNLSTSSTDGRVYHSGMNGGVDP